MSKQNTQPTGTTVRVEKQQGGQTRSTAPNPHGGGSGTSPSNSGGQGGSQTQGSGSSPQGGSNKK